MDMHQAFERKTDDPRRIESNANFHHQQFFVQHTIQPALIIRSLLRVFFPGPKGDKQRRPAIGSGGQGRRIGHLQGFIVDMGQNSIDKGFGIPGLPGA